MKLRLGYDFVDVIRTKDVKKSVTKNTPSEIQEQRSFLMQGV